MPKTPFPATGEALPLCEPIAILDTFVSGVAFTEELAPNLYRVVLYAEQRSTFENARERVVVERLVLTGEALAALSRAGAETLKMLPEAVEVPAQAVFN